MADPHSVPSGETSGTAVSPAQPNRVLWSPEENMTASVARQAKYLEREVFEGSYRRLSRTHQADKSVGIQGKGDRVER